MVWNGSVVLCRRYQEMSFQLRALAAVGGVETRSSKNWLPVAELRERVDGKSWRHQGRLGASKIWF